MTFHRIRFILAAFDRGDIREGEVGLAKLLAGYAERADRAPGPPVKPTLAGLPAPSPVLWDEP